MYSTAAETSPEALREAMIYKIKEAGYARSRRLLRQ